MPDDFFSDVGQDELRVNPPLFIRRDLSGQVMTFEKELGFWARVYGATDIVTGGQILAAYSWVEQRGRADGGLEDDPSGRTGTPITTPAVEANDDLGVADNTIVWLHDSLPGISYAFDSPGSGSGSEAIVLILSAVIQGPLSGCTSGSGSTSNSASSSGEIGNLCRPTVYRAVVQHFNQNCEVWHNGECIYAIEINGKRLEKNTRYKAVYSSPRIPAEFEGDAEQLDDPCRGTSPTKLYLVDAGDETVTIIVDQELGEFCVNSGSGSYSESASTSGEQDTSCLADGGGTLTGPNLTIIGLCCELTNLRIYTGRIEKWDRRTCQWYQPETDPVYIADFSGKALPLHKRFLAHYADLIPESILGDGTNSKVTYASSGSASGDGTLLCRPLYFCECLGYTGVLRTVEPPFIGTVDTILGTVNALQYSWPIVENHYVCGHLTCSVKQLNPDGTYFGVCMIAGDCLQFASGSGSFPKYSGGSGTGGGGPPPPGH